MSERKVVEYQFNNGYRVIWLEGILKEFRIETKESWTRHENEWFEQPPMQFEEPKYPDLYSILYTCLPEADNLYHEFAESLIEGLIANTCYLEGCLLKEVKQ